MEMNNMNVPSQLEYHSFDFHQDFEQQYIIGFDGTGFTGEGVMPQIPGYQPNISPPPSAFLGPKCALWDCTRPALGLEWCHQSDDYCSIYHAGLAPSEGYPGSPPVVRPRGIGLKDNLLFAALGSKAQGKEVGIPECEGAATAKSPWNAPGKWVVLIVYPLCVYVYYIYECFTRTVVQSSLISLSWMAKQSGSGCFLISHAEPLRVVTGSNGHFQITMGGVGMSPGNK